MLDAIRDEEARSPTRPTASSRRSLDELRQELRLRLRRSVGTCGRMASLKDLRNRIASVKATQKITKAMQMVAAAKLRRAQEAAEAARPYAERMDAVLANLAPARRPAAAAPRAAGRHRQGRRHLLVVAPPSAACAAASTRSIVRAARATHAAACWPRARRSRSSPSAARATTSCAATSAGRSSTASTSRGVKQLGFADADGDRRQGPGACSRPASSTSPRCSSPTSSR